ncbi:AAA family ATPase [Demetria terragena]|uniref:AAA family ATPase n=1 Tax=Demetria terragena TaxID=63959 RepID=UPI000688AD76|nr:AAA family ATPase [Demetria terragena]
MAEPQHLVVIRGNSASGKSSLARELQLAMGRGTANVGQDHLRRIVLREHDVPNGDNITLISETVRFCLRIGYHVIVEGILFSEHYGDMLRNLIAEHDGQRHVFYLDVSLSETLRRHASRPLASEVTADTLCQWYVPDDVLGIPGEVVLDGDQTPHLQGLVDMVSEHIGPVLPRDPGMGARFG